jgi:hypothetical protein
MAPPDDTHCPQDDASRAIGAGHEALAAENAALRSQITALLARVAELERRLGLNSGNSGKSPSSDGLKKPPRVGSLRGPADKKTAGQPGHPGKTLCQVPMPDLTVNRLPASCATGGLPLSAIAGDDYLARQVFDLPEPVRRSANHTAPADTAGRRGDRLVEISTWLLSICWSHMVEDYYPITPRPRWQKGRTPYTQLHGILEERRDAYSEFLVRIANNVDLLHSIHREPQKKVPHAPFWNNRWFSGLDAATLMNIIAWKRPARFIEIGSGHSTRFARYAIKAKQYSTRITSVGYHEYERLLPASSRTIIQANGIVACIMNNISWRLCS